MTVEVAGTIPLEKLGSFETVKVYSQAYVDRQEKRIKELEDALKKIAEIVPECYNNYRYLSETRLDIIGDICETVLAEYGE